MPVGVPFKQDVATIATVLKKHHGRIGKSAAEFGVERHCLRNAIQNSPELLELLAKLRFEYIELVLDAAEDTIVYAIGQREKELTNSIKAAMFTLNNLGKSRGYCHPLKADTMKSEGALELIDEVVVKDGDANVIRKAGGKHSDQQLQIQHMDRGRT